MCFLRGTTIGVNNGEIRQMFPRVLEFACLNRAVDRQLWTYSTGMTSRRSFAVAANVESEILLLDAALTSGDRSFAQQCYDSLQRLWKIGPRLVDVSYSTDGLRNICDRGLWIESGRVRACDDACEFFEQFEAATGGQTSWHGSSTEP
jgi:ABC-type polysaccharide/polyol phosphate transport system ATPase subunit